MDKNGRNAFRDPRSIDFQSDWEIGYWIKYLETTRDELLAAISEVGDSAEMVKRCLAAKRTGQMNGGTS